MRNSKSGFTELLGVSLTFPNMLCSPDHQFSCWQEHPSPVCQVDSCSFLTQLKPSLGTASTSLYHLPHRSLISYVDAYASPPPTGSLWEQRAWLILYSRSLQGISNEWVLNGNASTFIIYWYFPWASWSKWTGFDARGYQEPDRKLCLGGTFVLLYLISEVGSHRQDKLSRS